MKICYLAASALLALADGAVWCQTTSTYCYDALGRLTASTASGAPNGDVTTAIVYDPAGNRVSYKVASGATPTPTPTPTPAPSAPTALNPTLNFNSSGSYTIALSTLASSGSPARISAFSVPAGGGSASIAGNGQSVSYTAPAIAKPGMCEPAETYGFSVPYAVENTSGGRSASGTATINVRGPAGPRPTRAQQCP